MPLNTTSELLSDLKKGKMVVLMDDEDRENEGDLILPAGNVSPEAINFMAMHGRGLICLALTEDHCDRLKLDQMVKTNKSKHETAFTVSIEAASGITTGISAKDRSKTIEVASNPQALSSDIVQPGHIFPLKAENGGVLNRSGHTEASIDLARLSGFHPAAVICEIMNEDGSMSRRPDLEKFCEKHDLKIGTIADLINYRLSNEKSIELISESSIKNKYGEFSFFVYKDSLLNEVHYALKMGEIKSSEPTLVRVQQINIKHDIFKSNDFGERWSLEDAMKKISASKNGLIVLISSDLTQPDDDIEEKNDSSDSDKRRIGVGPQILKEFGVSKIRLLGAEAKYPSLSGFDLEVIEFISN